MKNQVIHKRFHINVRPETFFSIIIVAGSKNSIQGIDPFFDIGRLKVC